MTYSKEYYNTHKKEIAASNKKWRENRDAELWKEKKKSYYMANRERLLANQQRFYNTHKKVVLKRDKARRDKYRFTALSHYSDGKLCCACCGEKNIEFLAIDHINGGGQEHRRRVVGHIGGTSFYIWLKKNNYPEGYRVLCHNCNISLGNYGYCPHDPK